jgi:hypothetical protein
MGWTFSTHSQSKSDFVKQTLGEAFPAGADRSSFRLLKSSLRGNNLWVLCKRGNNPPEIGLFLLSRQDGCWGYKDMGESDGPFYYDCPLSFLAEAPEPDCIASRDHRGEGKSWRSFVRDFHANTSSRRRSRPKVGDLVSLPGDKFIDYGGTYAVTDDLGRKGLVLNNYLRLNSRQIKYLEPLAAAPAG